MRQVDFKIDVTAAVGTGERLMVAATAYLPDVLPDDVTVIAAFPGGGYNRSYFHLVIDGDESYSQALHHTARGFVLVSIDHLDSGDSSSPADRLGITFEHLAAVSDRAARETCSLLRTGRLLPDLGPLKVGLIIGIGHSMGGSFLTVTEGIHKTFDAVGILGHSAIRPSFPDPSGKGSIVGQTFPPRGTDLHKIEPVAGYTLEQLRYCFHYEDVPSSIVDADMGAHPGGPDVLSPPWRSATSPPCASIPAKAGFTCSTPTSIK